MNILGEVITDNFIQIHQRNGPDFDLLFSTKRFLAGSIWIYRRTLNPVLSLNATPAGSISVWLLGVVKVKSWCFLPLHDAILGIEIFGWHQGYGLRYSIRWVLMDLLLLNRLIVPWVTPNMDFLTPCRIWLLERPKWYNSQICRDDQNCPSHQKNISGIDFVDFNRYNFSLLCVWWWRECGWTMITYVLLIWDISNVTDDWNLM